MILLIIVSLHVVCCEICTHPIYCNTSVGSLISMASSLPGYNEDFKYFVDKPLSRSVEEVLTEFYRVQDSTLADKISFIELNFEETGSEIKTVAPVDFHEYPRFLDNIYDRMLKEWGRSIHKIWKSLVKKVEHTNPSDYYSSINVTYPFVVPGGRFTEFYYWDTFFVIKGLLISEMYETAKGMILNFFEMIERHGFILNGSRIYYLTRSQPPFLISMVEEYMNVTKDISFLDKIDLLEQEYDWWMENRAVTLEGHVLNHYDSECTSPRPEEYKNDFDLTSDPETYRDICSACESGWDFSSRWFDEKDEFDTIKTRNIIPVDLNSIMYKNELLLAKYYKKLEKEHKRKLFTQRARERSIAIDQFLWIEEDKCWYDYDYVDDKHNENFFVSNYLPLWVGIEKEKVSIPQEVLNYIGGIPVSDFYNNKEPQQWDLPNSWAPTTYFLIEVIKKIDEYDELLSVQKWINNCYCSYEKYKKMFEKYNVYRLGAQGFGGEYADQFGFGWTNGITLYYLNEYGDVLKANSCLDYLVFSIVVTVIILIFCMCFVGTFSLFIIYNIVSSRGTAKDVNESVELLDTHLK